MPKKYLVRRCINGLEPTGILWVKKNIFISGGFICGWGFHVGTNLNRLNRTAQDWRSSGAVFHKQNIIEKIGTAGGHTLKKEG
jgi:hypothetical protein